MFFAISFVYFGFFSALASGQQSGYALEFPAQGVTDFANVWGMRSLTEFTVCFWLKTTTAAGSPFSYASTNAFNNELLFFKPGNFELYISNKYVSTGVSAADGKWHQICATWSNDNGAWNFYKDGVLGKSGTNLMKGHTIRPGGSLMLGQEQDTVGGTLDKKQSFVGTLAFVNVWSYTLPADTIKEYARCCRAGEGNVYMWSDFIYGTRGNPRVIIPAGCPCA